eukprot:1580992-Rhodomonas_salina.11
MPERVNFCGRIIPHSRRLDPDVIVRQSATQSEREMDMESNASPHITRCGTYTAKMVSSGPNMISYLPFLDRVPEPHPSSAPLVHKRHQGTERSAPAAPAKHA